MTELETRKAALDFAMRTVGALHTDPAVIVTAAEKFFAFLSGTKPEPKEDLGEPSSAAPISRCDFGKADQTPASFTHKYRPSPSERLQHERDVRDFLGR